MHNHAASLAAVGVKIRELDQFGPQDGADCAKDRQAHAERQAG
jgi:hypothetical protein